jgi:thermitase
MSKRTWFPTAALLAALACVGPALAEDAWVPDRGARNVPGEIIVGFAPTVTLSEVNSIASSVGGKVIANFTTGKVRPTRIKLTSSDPAAVDDAMNRLKNDAALKGKIQYVEPNRLRRAFVRAGGTDVVTPFAQSGDVLLSQQWGYYDINANWINAPTTTTGVLVAVIDTGVDYNHPDLVGKVTKGYDFVNGDSDPMDDMGHGTHVAGIIAAKANNGNYGIAGVSWNAKILAIKALSSSGWGSSYDIALAIRAAANNSSVKVINMSLGGSDDSTVEREAVEYAVVTKGKLLVASAGNNGNSAYNYPAAYSVIYPGRVLAVAAHGPDHCKASFSTYGTWVSISAPGTDILSTVPISVPVAWSGTGFYSLDGTSMAAPHVAGAAALAWQKYATYTNLQVANLLTSLNAGSYTPLDRNGTCWPNDGSTFQRVDVLHLLEQRYYETCDNKGAILGNAFDAESGAPLAGGKVTAKMGTAVATDYVPAYGEATQFDGNPIASGYGLFNVLTLAGSNTLSIQKTGYYTFTPKTQAGLAEPVPVGACAWTDAGNIPVIPAKGAYWMVVTWDRASGSFYEYDLFSGIYQNNVLQDYVYWFNTGDVKVFPYTKLMWDSLDFDLPDPNVVGRHAESINVRKVLTGGRYVFFVDDYFGGAGSANWAISGIKAYLYKGSTLVKTYTPPAGAGEYWAIADVTSTAVIDRNTLSDAVPTSLTATAAARAMAPIAIETR